MISAWNAYVVRSWCAWYLFLHNWLRFHGFLLCWFRRRLIFLCSRLPCLLFGKLRIDARGGFLTGFGGTLKASPSDGAAAAEAAFFGGIFALFVVVENVSLIFDGGTLFYLEGWFVIFYSLAPTAVPRESSDHPRRKSSSLSNLVNNCSM